MPKKKAEDTEEEIVYDEADSALDKISDLKEKLKECKAERQEFLDGWQRAKADFLNFKKQSADNHASVGESAVEDFILDLFPVLDSFEMAFKDKEAWESAPEQWRKGIEYIYTQLTNLLENRGISTINPIDQPFDHNLHNSVESVETDDESLDGIVMEVILKGYKLNDKIIRPAQVKVFTSK
jgi:molecular chaperone GrpE